MKKLAALTIIILLTFFLNQSGSGQNAEEMKAIREEIKALKEGQMAIQRELQEIKSLLRTRQAQPHASSLFKEALVNIDTGHVKGDGNAQLVMIEFSEYQCPFCARFFRMTLPQIQKDYIETGKMKYVFMDFPLPIHREAMKASEAALCAGDQGKWEDMHERLFANQRELSIEALLKHGEALGLDMTQFKECIDSGKYSTQIKASITEGQKVGITGTPTFLFGFTEADGRVRATKKISGAVPYTNFKATIDEMLSSMR